MNEKYKSITFCGEVDTEIDKKFYDFFQNKEVEIIDTNMCYGRKIILNVIYIEKRIY